jgi:hypothetical protein
MLWALWHARLKIIHEGLLQSPLSTHHFIEQFLADLEMLVPTSINVSSKQVSDHASGWGDEDQC